MATTAGDTYVKDGQPNKNESYRWPLGLGWPWSSEEGYRETSACSRNGNIAKTLGMLLVEGQSTWTKSQR